MNRKKYGLTEYRFLKYMREGRGQGTGKNYKPWHLVSDLSSKGRSHRIYWWKTDRVHHLLSDIELLVFLFLIRDDEVEDIREQYPLPRPDTVRIAKALGIRHPVDPQSRALWVMTTDFLVTISTPQGESFLAIAAKPEQGLNDSVQKKLEIERCYWEMRQIPWLLVFDSQVKTTFGMNLWWIFDGSDRPMHQDHLERIFSLLVKQRQTNPLVPIKQICAVIDTQLALSEGMALRALRRLLGWKWVTVDLNLAHIQDLPISEFNFGVPKCLYVQ